MLQAVDAVFARPATYDALSSDKTKTVHEALPDKLPGHVDIWPLVLPEKKDDIEGWDAPFDTIQRDPVRRCGWRKRSPRI